MQAHKSVRILWDFRRIQKIKKERKKETRGKKRRRNLYWSLDAGFVGDWIWRAVSIDARESAKWESNYRVVIVRAAFTDSTACCHARHLISRLFPPRPGTGPEDGNLIGKKKCLALWAREPKYLRKGFLRAHCSIPFASIAYRDGRGQQPFLFFSFHFSLGTKKNEK